MKNDPFSKLGAIDQKLFQKADIQPKQSSEKPPKSTPQKPVNRPTNQSTDRLTNQSTSRSTSQSITSPPVGNRILEKPKAFYITERLNKRLDDAVRYYQERHNMKKVDRSVIVTALLDNEANWTEETLELMLDRVMSQLTSRLTNR
jgi:hypothetical protein